MYVHRTLRGLYTHGMNSPLHPDSVLPIHGKYHIVRPLKVGGTAAIYLAVMRGEDNFSREVVVKRPLPHLMADLRSRKMFVDEAHIASRLNHPNICQVLDLVSRQDEIYLVLEYLRGVDLREILKQCIRAGHLIPPEIAVWMGIEVCAGLDFAHNALNRDGRPLELVHRDVSPKNIRITFSGSVKVIDFGIAWATGRQTETAAGTIKGTLGYMSPEQILGDEIDRRSDIFAFGICLFQTLTNRNPFDGPTLKERVRRLTQAPVPSVCDYNPSLDEEIGAIVARCLDRDITRRYARMCDVQVDLERYLARLQVVSPTRRLVQFMEQIFPEMHVSDEALATALSELSQVTGRIDTSLRLVFPDDPPTEMGPVGGYAAHGQTAATQGPATSATQQEGTRATQAAGAPPQTYPYTEAGQTRPMAAATAQIPALARLNDPAVPEPRSKLLLPVLALVAALVLGLVFGIGLWMRPDQVLVTPLDPDLQPVAALDAGPKPAPRDAAVAKPPAKVKPPITKTIKRPPPRPKPPAVKVDKQKARLMFRTARRFEKAGRSDDAQFMYHLAYASSGSSANPSIFLNLGLIYNADQDEAKAQACLRRYLKARPSATNAAQIRTLLSSFSGSATVACVSKSQVRGARKRYARAGPIVDEWMQDTLQQMLR